MTVGVLGLLLAVTFGALGYISERTITWGGQKYQFDIYAVPHRVTEPAKP
jgi:hypothetical protein